VLRTIGPGVIGLGIAIGSGEWLLGPSVVASYGAAMLWITSVAVLLQVLLNLEMARYTLYTGEPIMTGFMRTWPGPRFWSPVYAALAFLQVGWPGWALASATASATLLLGRLPGDADAGVVIVLGYVTFAACLAIVTLGRKVERTIEIAMWVMVGWIALFLVVLDLATVSAANWGRLVAGFASLGSLPEGADWVLLGAFAAYSGLGGVSNAFITNWMRDKGYGMGATVGYIPTAFAGPVRLRPHGRVFEVDADARRHWRAWWRFVNVDQWGVFGLGSIAGMVLTVALTLQFVPPGAAVGGWAVASLQADAIARVHGAWLWYLTLVCGLAILFSTQLGNVDGLPRIITDMLWSASTRVRRRFGDDVRPLYYGVLGLFALWGAVALNLAQPLTLVVIGANMAGANFVLISLHTLVTNRRFLPHELRPAAWREAALVLCAAFYAMFAGIALLRVWR
jgi:hypothetical protein